mmetsp:Transcript_36483/g.43589  ORF Transcript_36483/g.43589 Transcript_36483/m.43589 type:complete len:533 (+) Transcript_36483:152-1750(+)
MSVERCKIDDKVNDKINGNPSPSPLPSQKDNLKTLHIAPMLNYSNREFRQLLRILTRKATLWTEMIVDETIIANIIDNDNDDVNVIDNVTTINGNDTNNERHNHHHLDEHLGYDPSQHPLVCQIGGNSPTLCGKATTIVEDYGYDAIDLNIDCPSVKVSGEREFGAILLKRVDVALAVVTAMKEHSTTIPISIKTRVGVDEYDDIHFIAEFIRKLIPVCTRFVLHARKCILDGLMNARQNRTVPPLNYPRVYQLCRMFPECDFWINGGIRTLIDAKAIVYGLGYDDGCLDQLNPSVSSSALSSTSTSDCSESVHSVPCNICNLPNGSCTSPPSQLAPPNLKGCMLGRAAMDDPCLFWDTDRYFYGERDNPCHNRSDVLHRYCTYLERTYPRRCCDDDERITFEYPAPVGVVVDADCCPICQDIYDDGGGKTTMMNRVMIVQKGALSPTTKRDETQQYTTRPKISSRIIARCLKPIQGLFAGIPNTRIFRRTCDELAQNRRVRNCGPGYIVRKAMESISDEILEKDFVHTDTR